MHGDVGLAHVRQAASASEWIATVEMPSVRQVRNTRDAISARLATIIVIIAAPRRVALLLTGRQWRY